MKGVLPSAKPGSRGLGLNAGRHFSSAGRRCSLSSLYNAHLAASGRAGAQQQGRQSRLPPLRAASSQLSQAELEELLAENAKLKQLLNTYRDRLSPDQVERLTKQYEEIAALAAAAGLQLDPIGMEEGASASSSSSAGGQQQAAKQGAAAGASAGGAAAAAAAPSKAPPQPKSMEVSEGDRKVKAWVVEKGDVVQFSFDGVQGKTKAPKDGSSSKTSSNKPPAASAGAAQAAPSAPKPAGATAAPAPAAGNAPAAKPAAAAPASTQPAAAGAAAAADNNNRAAAAPSSVPASDPVAAFIQATKAKASASAPPKPTPAPPAAAPASSNGQPAAAAAPAAAASSSSSSGDSSDSSDSSSSNGSRASRWTRMAEEAEAKKKTKAPAAPAAAAPAQQPAAAAAAAPPAAAAPKPQAAAAPAPAAAAAAAPAPAAAKQQPPAPAASAAPAPAAAPAAQPKPAAAPPAAAPPAARGPMPPPPPAARLKPGLHQPQARPAQDYTGPAPTSPLFSGSSTSSSSSSSSGPSSSGGSSSGPGVQAPATPTTTTAIVDVGPPPPAKKKVGMDDDDILDIPDPVQEAVKVLSKITPEERARREELKKKEREVATKLLQAHDPPTSAATRHSWLIYTVPEKPVAGCDVIVYYNRSQSEVLRDRNRIQCILGFNQWELQAEQGKVDLYPSSIPHIDGSDFWCCRFKIPENAFEINFVMTDGEQLFDNNAGQDYTYPTTAGGTWEEWQAAARERAEEQEKERHRAEEVRRAEEAKQAKEEKEKQDRENALRRVAELRDGYAGLVEGAMTRRKVDAADPTSATYWYVTPRPPVVGQKATLLYNSKAGPLAWIEDKRKNKDKATPVEGQPIPKVLLGFNNWKVKLDPQPMKHSSIQGDDDEVWWEASFEIPKGAVAVNFVVNCDNAWDNNGGKDHKIAVELPKPHTPATVSEWAEEMLPDFIKQEREARLAAEKIAAEKEAKRMVARNKSKEIAKAVVRRQMKHVMFTEPEVIQAGEKVTVYYNPDDTVLAGSSEIYFTGGFNRWNHKRSLGPVKMRPPGINGRHWRVSFNVPKEAVQLDFVFSNVMSGDGLYDNRGGFDYHLPIEGGTGSISQRLHVCHIAVEMAPVAKVGGLGDVVTALARAVQEEGHLVEVILPRYDFFLQSPVLAGQMRYETEFDWGGTRIFVSTAIVEGLRVFFIEPRNNFFATPTVYGRYDDEVRFDFFCKAALEFLLKTGRQPDILHCHDWSTAHVAKAFWEDYQPYGLYNPKVVFTIHNMNYGQKKITEAAQFCQRFTTVSPTYAFEVGGHPAIAGQTAKFMGIRNGIDPDLWSPTENKFLPMPYDAETALEGKRRAREELRKRVNMSSWNDKCIIAVVSRLTPQKGVHLIKHAAYKAQERGCQFVLLGSAPDPKVQAEFDELNNELGHGQDAGFVFAYDEPLSHIIYAAADILLVPSMFEPCGLTQMIAMRYGSVPVVRHTGGLRDTVFDVDQDKARAAWEVAGSSDWMRDKIDETNGFAFEGTDEGGLDYALNRAIDAYYNDPAWFRSLQARIMRQDWSWNRPALDYCDLYYACSKS